MAIFIRLMAPTGPSQSQQHLLPDPFLSPPNQTFYKASKPPLNVKLHAMSNRTELLSIGCKKRNDSQALSMSFHGFLSAWVLSRSAVKRPFIYTEKHHIFASSKTLGQHSNNLRFFEQCFGKKECPGNIRGHLREKYLFESIFGLVLPFPTSCLHCRIKVRRAHLCGI